MCRRELERERQQKIIVMIILIDKTICLNMSRIHCTCDQTRAKQGYLDISLQLDK